MENGSSVRSAAEMQHVLAFNLAQRMYALPLAAVVQIIPMVALTPVPQMPPAVEGLMNFRGKAVPLINLRRYLGLPECALALHTPIILLMVEGRTVGLIVDAVIDVLQIDAQQVIHLTEIMPEGLGDAPILQGIVHTPSGTLLVLNLQQLFAAGQAQTFPQVFTELAATLADAAVEMPAENTLVPVEEA